MATIKDISKELNLGVSTVSMALNGNPRISEETRRRVLEKAKELKYVKNIAAVDLQKGRTNLILFVVNDPSRSFFSTFINQLQRAVARHGYDFLIATTYEGHDETAKRYIQEHRADAVIVYTSTISDTFIQENASETFPIFVLGREVKGSHIFSFYKQTKLQGAEMIDYLAARGHRSIAFVKGSPYSLGTQRKYKGYLYGLQNNHLPFDERFVFDAHGSERDDGYQITETILPHLHELDAIFYSNDEIAIGGMDCLKQHSVKIPKDISIVGANNSILAEYVSPRLTSSGSQSYGDDYIENIIAGLISLIEGEAAENRLIELGNIEMDTIVYERESVMDRSSPLPEL